MGLLGCVNTEQGRPRGVTFDMDKRKYPTARQQGVLGGAGAAGGETW